MYVCREGGREVTEVGICVVYCLLRLSAFIIKIEDNL